VALVIRAPLRIWRSVGASHYAEIGHVPIWPGRNGRFAGTLSAVIAYDIGIEKFDALIAATALAAGASIATRDTGGFAGCGLTVVDPWTAS
jgi:predicted nucleic acid-binding protein